MATTSEGHEGQEGTAGLAPSEHKLLRLLSHGAPGQGMTLASLYSELRTLVAPDLEARGLVEIGSKVVRITKAGREALAIARATR